MFNLSVIYNDVRKMLEGQEEKREALKAAMGTFIDSIAADIMVDKLVAARKAYAEMLVEFDYEPNMQAALTRLVSIENNPSEQTGQTCTNIERAPGNDIENTLKEWLKSLE